MLHLIRKRDLLCVQHGRFRFRVGGWVVQRTSVTSIRWLLSQCLGIRPDQTYSTSKKSDISIMNGDTEVNGNEYELHIRAPHTPPETLISVWWVMLKLFTMIYFQQIIIIIILFFFCKLKVPWMTFTKVHPQTNFTPFQKPGIYLTSANYLAGKAPLYIIYSVKRKKGAI